MKKLVALCVIAALAIPAFAFQDDPCPEDFRTTPPKFDGPGKKEPGRFTPKKKSAKKPVRRTTRRHRR